MVETLKPTIYDQENPGNYIPAAPDEKPAEDKSHKVASLKATIYNQEDPGTYIPKAPEVEEPTKADGGVLQFPDVYDETNLPLIDQYKLDYHNLNPRQKRGLKVGAAAMAATIALLATAPGVTTAQGLQTRINQIASLIK
jgi:hypothetical protein